MFGRWRNGEFLTLVEEEEGDDDDDDEDGGDVICEVLLNKRGVGDDSDEYLLALVISKLFRSPSS